MLANRAVARLGVDVATVHLGSPEQVSQLVLGRGGLRPDPELRGEYARLPLRFKRRRGIALDELAQEVADAQGLSARRVQDEILRALERTGRGWRRPAGRVPSGVLVPLEEWRGMSAREREAAVGFFRAGQVRPETGLEHRPRVRVEGHRFLLRLHSPWKGQVTEVNPMTTFSQALRSAIRQGVRPATAMREAWRQVRAGRVSPPPRGRRQRTPAARLMARGLPPRGENPLMDEGEIGGFVESRRRAIQGLNFTDDAIKGMTAVAIGQNPRKGERLRPELKEVRRLVRVAARTGGTVPYDLRTLVESGVGVGTIRKVYRAPSERNPYRVTAFGERKKKRGEPSDAPRGRKTVSYAYDVLGPYDSPTRLPGTGSFTFPDLQSAKRYAAKQFADPEIRQVAISTMQGKEIERYHRRRKNPAQFCPERVEAPAHFDPRSFRTVTVRRHRITVGCPTGQYDARRRRCKIGTRAQRVLHPAGERGTCPIGGAEVNPPGTRPIRYSQLSESEREALVKAYTQARHYTDDPLHAAAIAARDVLIRSDKEWNTARGSDAFGAAVAVLAFRRAMKVNPVTRADAEILKTARGIMGRALTRAETRESLKTARDISRWKRGRPERRPVYRVPANPRAGPVKIYDRLLGITAQKGPGSRFPGQRFEHGFKPGARVWGLPDGRVLLG